jgi:hypothetical protein
MAKDTCPVIPNVDFMTLRLTAKREKELSGANLESPEGGLQSLSENLEW